MPVANAVQKERMYRIDVDTIQKSRNKLSFLLDIPRSAPKHHKVSVTAQITAENANTVNIMDLESIQQPKRRFLYFQIQLPTLLR